MEARKAKLFKNGGSQAVRIPSQFAFDENDDVYIEQDDQNGDIRIFKRPSLRREHLIQTLLDNYKSGGLDETIDLINDAPIEPEDIF